MIWILRVTFEYLRVKIKKIALIQQDVIVKLFKSNLPQRLLTYILKNIYF
jgi:hypothetical protein